MKTLTIIASLFVLSGGIFAAEPLVLDVWPGKPPGEAKELPHEADQTKDTDRLIAGRRIIKLGNVSTPQIAVHRPAKEMDTGASVLICPGGGFNILAYDLEGTEVAAWFNSIGVTGIVLKYRVPFRDPDRRWFAAVQDAQRAMSLVRGRAAEWNLDPKRIGICGFSAGGATAVFTSTFLEKRKYTPLDEVDKTSSRPDFAVIIYPGGLDDRATGQPRADAIKVTRDVPPMFFVHASDDRVSPLNSLLLAVELKKAGVPVEVHVYSLGGHGYGLRRTGMPVTSWPARCEEWMRASGFLNR